MEHLSIEAIGMPAFNGVLDVKGFYDLNLASKNYFQIIINMSAWKIPWHGGKKWLPQKNKEDILNQVKVQKFIGQPIILLAKKLITKIQENYVQLFPHYDKLEELREQDPEKKNPHRAVFDYYIQILGDLKDLLVQQPDLADTSQGKVAWKGD
ncbi:hypothetical protein ACJX0J_036144, partial [Zea mays]